MPNYNNKKSWQENYCIYNVNHHTVPPHVQSYHQLNWRDFLAHVTLIIWPDATQTEKPVRPPNFVKGESFDLPQVGHGVKGQAPAVKSNGLAHLPQFGSFSQLQAAIRIWPPDDRDFLNSDVQLCYK